MIESQRLDTVLKQRRDLIGTRKRISINRSSIESTIRADDGCSKSENLGILSLMPCIFSSKFFFVLCKSCR